MSEENKQPIVAICYDFDKTLSPKDMQNFSLIPKLGCDVDEFWKESNEIAKQKNMDNILSYMKLIVDKAQSGGLKISSEDFKALGKSIELFAGVESWFDRINQIAKSLGIKVEHYIISAGLKEIIQGTPIAEQFERIFASEFCYDEYGRPVWPCRVVNYTTKTQYLFRINKGCLDLSNENSVNEYIPNEERRIPMSNFIYIGDSETDIPAMKIVKQGGGTSIGVYNPTNCDIDKVKMLIKQDRIDYLLPADYSAGSKIENTVKSILNEIHSRCELQNLHLQQLNFVNALEEIEDFVEYADKFLAEDFLFEDISIIKRRYNKILKEFKKEVSDKYANLGVQAEIDSFVKKQQKRLDNKFKEKKQALDAKEKTKSVKKKSD